MWWIYSVWFKPLLFLGSAGIIIGWIWFQNNRIDHWKEQAQIAQTVAKAARITQEAEKAKRDAGVRAEAIRERIRDSRAVTVDLVTDPRLAAWLDGVFGESTVDSTR